MQAEASSIQEFASLDRCAAFVAAREAAEAIHQDSPRWPPRIALHARRLAAEAVIATREALGHGPVSASRRRCVRVAIGKALELAAACDAAVALGIADDELLRLAGRTVSLLGLLFYAGAAGD